MFHKFSVIFELSILLVKILQLVSSSTVREDAPPWQTIFPDTKRVIALFGDTGPRWRLDSQDQVYTNLTARVPGDVVSDLMHNGVVGDPYFDNNLWQQQEVWLGPQNESDNNRHKPKSCQKKQTRVWTYSTEIELEQDENDSHDEESTWKLILESVKMGATVHWNGVFLANVTDQFLRYSLPLEPKHLLAKRYHGKEHILSITFDPSIETDGRFMACSGGWDWAPYTLACDDKGSRILTTGLVQPIYLIAVDHMTVSYVVPKVYYEGSLPRTPWGKHADTDFRVSLNVHLDFVLPRKEQHPRYFMLVKSDFTDGMVKKRIDMPTNATSHVVTYDMIAPKDRMELWWPNGMGSQRLKYSVYVALADGSDRRTSWIQRRIGFRTSALVTTNETASNRVPDFLVANNNTHDEGTGLHGMYFRINGALVMARGGNIIPNDQLEGRYGYGSGLDGLAYEIIVQSAANAHMNMIRVWGGGKILPQAFYDACDDYGILVYQDQMFDNEHNHGPMDTRTMKQEIQHTVRSLATHASIVVWNGCNECQVIMGTESEIYAKFVLKIVADEDDTRSIWPSSPSKFGWKSGVNIADSKPNGKPLATRDPSDYKRALETHGPYMRSFSKTYPGVNGVDQHFPYPDKPRRFNEDPIGPEYPNVFASEFGSSVWSSFESLSATLRPEHWSLHGNDKPDQCFHIVGNENVCEGSNVMAQRNYPCDTHIEAYFGNITSLNAVGEEAFQAQLYQCIMAQTLWMKGELEQRRSENSFGLLIWQLNENWPTGGWGLVEYSAPHRGQVLGGRWKPLMHLLESSLFRDVFAACGRSNRCYVRNDGMLHLNVAVTLEAWSLASSSRTAGSTFTYNATLPGGKSATERFQAPRGWGPDKYDTVLIRVLDSNSGSILMEESSFLWRFPKAMPNIMRKVDVTLLSVKQQGLDNRTAEVTISSSGLALFVVLTTAAPGRFQENAFVLRPHQTKCIPFTTLSPGAPADVDMLRRTLRIEHLGYYFDKSNKEPSALRTAEESR